MTISPALIHLPVVPLRLKFWLIISCRSLCCLLCNCLTFLYDRCHIFLYRYLTFFEGGITFFRAPSPIFLDTMIRINRNYSYGMGNFELYKTTRCCWKANNQQANKVKYGFALYDGIAMEVYQITVWLPAYSTMHTFEKP